MKKKQIIEKLDKLYGENHPCDYVKEKLTFSKKCQYIKIPNYKFCIGLVFLICSAFLIAISSSFISLEFGRKECGLNRSEELEEGLFEYKDYYQSLNSKPIICFDYYNSETIMIYEGVSAETKQNIYFYEIHLAESFVNSNLITIRVNGDLILLDDSVIYGYIGEVTEIYIVVTINNIIKTYEYDV